jgi:hypothetical protein
LGAGRGKPLRLPEKFRPEPEFLKFHREQIFERRAQQAAT